MKLSKRGVLTIPAAIRKEFGLRKGDRIVFVREDEEEPALLDRDFVIRYRPDAKAK